MKEAVVQKLLQGLTPLYHVISQNQELSQYLVLYGDNKIIFLFLFLCHHHGVLKI